MVSWTDDPFARCIARAPIGDQRETVLREIQRPLDKRLFFAGEHTDERPGPGGMDGAIRSGLRVVNEVMGARPGQSSMDGAIRPGPRTVDKITGARAAVVRWSWSHPPWSQPPTSRR
jgi:hypothetical protein